MSYFIIFFLLLIQFECNHWYTSLSCTWPHLLFFCIISIKLQYWPRNQPFLGNSITFVFLYGLSIWISVFKGCYFSVPKDCKVSTLWVDCILPLNLEFNAYIGWYLISLSYWLVIIAEFVPDIIFWVKLICFPIKIRVSVASFHY